MIAVDNPIRWARTIIASHAIATRVEVWRDGERIVDDLPISAGSVVRDLGSQITASATIEVADPSYLPVSQDSPLAPLGSSLRIFTGLRYPDNSLDMPQVFDGPIVSVPTWPGAAGSFSVKAEGWLRYVADDRFTEPAAPSGPSAIDELSLLLLESVPWAAVVVDPAIVDGPVPEGLVFEEDRMDAVEALASSLGAIVTETPDGRFLIAPDPMPDAGAAPVREFRHGAEGAVLEGSVPELVRGDRYNGVVAYNPEDPDVRHLATVDDPANPVRWGGPYGRRAAYYASPLLTAETVQQAAETRLSTINGRMRTVDVSVLPDPSLEPGDHVLVSWPAAYSDPMGQPWSEVLMVRKVEHPLVPGRTVLQLRGTGAA